jgi:hypothetical protein
VYSLIDDGVEVQRSHLDICSDLVSWTLSIIQDAGKMSYEDEGTEANNARRSFSCNKLRKNHFDSDCKAGYVKRTTLLARYSESYRLVRLIIASGDDLLQRCEPVEV